MLENFKAYRIYQLSMKVPSWRLLQNDIYLTKDQNYNSDGKVNLSTPSQQSSWSQNAPSNQSPNEHAVDNDLPKEQLNYGPNTKGEYFTKEQADQLNMALAIRTIDFDYFNDLIWIDSSNLNATVQT